MDTFSQCGRPTWSSEIWMDAYGHGRRRVDYPPSMAYFLQTCTRFLLRVRAIVLEAIYLEFMKSIRR
jgi:hypothetical protein